MKKRKVIYSVFMLAALTSCQSGETTENGEQNQNGNAELVEEVKDVVLNYSMNADSSKADWERYLHQGPTKKKVKMFGADVEVDLGEIELTSSGDVVLTEGLLTKVNDHFTEMTAVFDMTTLKLNTNMEDKSDDLFKTKEYPHSELIINAFTVNGEGYELSGEMTIAEVTNPVTISATITEGENTSIQGEMKIQTLDYPLREEDAKKSVIEDEITINLELMFHQH